MGKVGQRRAVNHSNSYRRFVERPGQVLREPWRQGSGRRQQSLSYKGTSQGSALPERLKIGGKYPRKERPTEGELQNFYIKFLKIIG